MRKSGNRFATNDALSRYIQTIFGAAPINRRTIGTNGMADGDEENTAEDADQAIDGRQNVGIRRRSLNHRDDDRHPGL